MNSSSSFPFELNLGSQPIDVGAVVANNKLAAGTTAAAATAGLLWYLLRSDNSSVKQIRGWPLIGQWDFFTR